MKGGERGRGSGGEGGGERGRGGEGEGEGEGKRRMEGDRVRGREEEKDRGGRERTYIISRLQCWKSLLYFINQRMVCDDPSTSSRESSLHELPDPRLIYLFLLAPVNRKLWRSHDAEKNAQQYTVAIYTGTLPLGLTRPPICIIRDIINVLLQPSSFGGCCELESPVDAGVLQVVSLERLQRKFLKDVCSDSFHCPCKITIILLHAWN